MFTCIDLLLVGKLFQEEKSVTLPHTILLQVQDANAINP